MSMSSENFIGLEAKCIQLLNDIEYVLNDENPDAEVKAINAYDRILALEMELYIAIKNLKPQSKSKDKYKYYLDKILLYKNSIYMIAHIL